MWSTRTTLYKVGPKRIIFQTNVNDIFFVQKTASKRNTTSIIQMLYNSIVKKL